MEFPLKVMVIALLALIAFVILVALLQYMSGGTVNILGGIFKWFGEAMP